MTFDPSTCIPTLIGSAGRLIIKKGCPEAVKVEVRRWDQDVCLGRSHDPCHGEFWVYDYAGPAIFTELPLDVTYKATDFVQIKTHMEQGWDTSWYPPQTPIPTPEPAGILLAGLVLLAWLRRRA